MIRTILRWITRLLFSLLSDIEIVGKEKIPDNGGVIVAVNHMSMIDPALVFVMLDRRDATVLAADKHRKNPFLHLIINQVRGIWINREAADIDALRTARDYLRAGGLLGIAPEGTRSRVGALIPARSGVAYLADKAQVPVLPAAISGTEVAFKQLLRLHRPHLTVQFGNPFSLPPIERRNREACLRRNTDEIMCRIAMMLPAKYWGAYADHSRLKELLANPQAPIPSCVSSLQAQPA